MKIEIWSDIACPYCYIGKRKLEDALTKFPNRDRVELIWHSYELDPELPQKALSESIYSYFSKKNRIAEVDARKSMEKVAKLAEDVGLHYDFDKLIVANTSNALRFVKLAAEISLATEAEEVLFEAYFVKGLDISDRDVLVQLGVKIGLSEQQVVSMLDSDVYFGDIKKDIEYSERVLNLQYIPFYVFNDKHMVQGSISSDEYFEILTKSYSEWEQGIVVEGDGEMMMGQSCSIDGVCS